MCYWGSRIR